jgi:hypothetical protein
MGMNRTISPFGWEATATVATVNHGAGAALVPNHAHYQTEGGDLI